MPAPKGKIYAYAVVNTVRTVEPPELDLSGYPNQLPPIGSIACYEEDHGRNTHIESRIDGPIFDSIVFRYVGTGEILDGEPFFDEPAKRMMALLQIGSQNEQVLRASVHQLLEEIRGKVEENKLGPDWLQAQINAIEKAFLK